MLKAIGAVSMALSAAMCHAASVSFTASTVLSDAASLSCGQHVDCAMASVLAHDLVHDNEFEITYTPVATFYGVLKLEILPRLDPPPTLNRPAESDYVATVSAYNQQGWLLYHASQSFGASWTPPTFELTPGVDAGTPLTIKVNFTFNPGYVIDNHGVAHFDRADAAIAFNAIPIDEPPLVVMVLAGVAIPLLWKRRSSARALEAGCSRLLNHS